MPTLDKRLTDTIARELPCPPIGYELHWCPRTPGFGVRVTAGGAKAWIAERRLNGKTVRRTLGKAAGPAAISSEAARKLQLDVSSELQQGRDRSAERREDRKAEKAERAAEEETFEVALRTYVADKRRAKDGLPLKARTRSDYLRMIEPAGTKKNGAPLAEGELVALASRPISKIAGTEIRAVYAATLKRGERRAVAAA